MTQTLLLAVAGVVAAVPASAAGFKLERRLPLQPGGRFTLSTDVGQVSIAGESAPEVSIVVTSSREDLDRLFDFRFDERPDAVEVTVTRRGSWLQGLFDRVWFHGDDTQIAIRVPRPTAVDVSASGGSVHATRLMGEARLHSSGGGVRVEESEARVDVHSSGGSIQVRNLRGTLSANTSGGGFAASDVQGTVKVTSRGGGIQANNVSGDVSAETSGGSVRIVGAGGRVEAHSSGGRVSVGFAAHNGSGGSLSSSGGGVSAELDPTVALTIDATSSGGGVRSDLSVTTRGAITRGSLRGDVNGGGPTLRLRSSGGGIRISAPNSSR